MPIIELYAKKNIAAVTAQVAISMTNDFFTSPAFVGSSTARDQVGALLQKAMVAETSDVAAMINKAFADAIEECEYYS